MDLRAVLAALVQIQFLAQLLLLVAVEAAADKLELMAVVAEVLMIVPLVEVELLGKATTVAEAN
jgi:hypothetical protein